ncbi:transcriptional regulator, MarR family [Terribacillus aidingensis]|uniref:Transcriptional regulator, MarR family n=1 Tax=Terribacillus aidingensis TaxID=586416 RepID=A0A285N240_9BACI|nr:ROK family transcriptional regulator [Terribacillus aidingensis]SNZ03500.1 transcriptional regulator, MarR family [Terribacillus aidingensis]
MQRGTFQLMKTVNRSLILNKIRLAAPISRADIAKETGLTPPTVSTIVKELIEQGLVVESTLGSSSGGRKPKMLRIRTEGLFVIGVDAGPETVDCILTTLTGEVIGTISRNLQVYTNREFLKQLSQAVDYLLESYSVKREHILGIGIAMHGVVDAEAGIGQVAPILKLHNIPIKQEMESAFGVPVKVENDARAMALGEAWFGKYDTYETIVAVNIGSGIGAGIIIQGRLLHGAAGLAGEFGHMSIDLNGEICACGNRGCLQTFASGPAIAKRAGMISGEAVYQAAVRGEETARNILQETGRTLGIGLINLIHLLNPDRIILGGGVMQSAAYLLPSLKEEIKARALTDKAAKTEIHISELEERATALGAVALLLEELFAPV